MDTISPSHWKNISVLSIETNSENGYRDAKLVERSYQVTIGEAWPKDWRDLEKFALYRAAELTKGMGLRYFAILDSSTQTTQATINTPSNSYTAETPSIHGNTAIVNALTVTNPRRANHSSRKILHTGVRSVAKLKRVQRSSGQGFAGGNGSSEILYQRKAVVPCRRVNAIVNHLTCEAILNDCARMTGKSSPALTSLPQAMDDWPHSLLPVRQQPLCCGHVWSSQPVCQAPCAFDRR